ncbi:MAG: hypothetical protein RI924_11 [Bacteroidota bacterium]|jgi:uncharacterized OsmC-like protein
MATVETVYLGELRTQATHVRSGEQIITDAPIDNQGKGEAFSPTDLLATALGSCILTVMGIVAREQKVNIDGTTCSITKVMATDPRRVGAVEIVFNFPAGEYSDKVKIILERAAKTCPVAKSLHPDLEEKLVFNWS